MSTEPFLDVTLIMDVHGPVGVQFWHKKKQKGAFLGVLVLFDKT